ncbi:MAG: response regulator [Pirellulales bacterium]|nr:response regulator [Pirellulales bacterium]
MNEAAKPSSQTETTRLASAAAKIMIVDDDPTTVDLVTFHLGEMGYRNFVTCTEGRDVVKLVETERPDVLLLDLVMPDAEGLVILREVRSSHEPACLPVIILTAIEDSRAKIEAFELGATDFLNKPVNFVELAPRIRNALLVKSYHDQLKRHAEELQRLVELKTASLKESHASLERANLVLRRSCEAAETAARAKSEFLANVSHELRTPLTAVIGFTEELLADSGQAALPPRFAELLPVILRNGKHLLQIVSDILDVARIERGRLAIERVECSPESILKEVIHLLEPSARAKQLSLSWDAAGPMPPAIHSDPMRLRQILINLISNAIKFTEKGSVRVVTRLLGAGGPAPLLQFQVIDTGIGIKPDQIAEIFKPFTQALAADGGKYEGAGLGLTICKYLAEELGGQIQVESQLGVGSAFRVTVAAGAPRDAAAPDNAGAKRPDDSSLPNAPPPRQCLASKRVLLAEDAPDNQRLIRFILEKAGATVTIANDGRAALELATNAWRAGEPFDVILTDIQMPHMDGYQLTASLRSQGYPGALVAVTANAMAGEHQKCLAAGCDDYLSKPIDRTKLVSLVAHHAK